MKNKLFTESTKNLIKWIGTRIFVAYLLFGLIFLMLVDQKKIYFSELNHNMLSFDYLARFSNDKKLYNKKKMKEYIRYFKKVTKYMPDYANGYNFLGYCYYYSGRKKAALKAYQKAVELNPKIFWLHFNLGMIHYRERNFSKAAENFRQAVTVPLEPHQPFVSQSREYRLFLRHKELPEIDIGRQLLSRFSEGYLLLLLSEYEMGHYDEVYRIAMKATNPNFIYQDIFFYYAGLAAYYKKDLSSALTLLKKAVDLNPNFAEAHYLLGKGLSLIGRSQASAVHIKKAVQLRRQGPSPLLGIKEFDVAIY